MNQMNTWSNLACACGSEKFVQMIALRWTNGSGTVATPALYRCAQCNEEVDSAKLIAQLTLRQKKQELAQLEEEVGHADSGRRTISSENRTLGQKDPSPFHAGR